MVARGLVTMARQLSRERYYCCEISVCGDEVARLDCSSGRILSHVAISHYIPTPIFGGLLPAYLVAARPYEGIVAEVSTDIGGDDLSVDAVLWNEILICAGGC